MVSYDCLVLQRVQNLVILEQLYGIYVLMTAIWDLFALKFPGLPLFPVVIVLFLKAFL